ncbi:hypothetical protein LWI29_000752 [Acer saccharum]|uniref:LOB domain-containing protein n=1 Tax=Acer saccharum TaxID=4024 RepID=A0AA39VHC7_ACESA|nr:hypothetical protein LWI29_000752 [Acer saccharum]
MTSSGSPCGACKFLRRKCVRGCVFAPYFCHEQGATHFAAIHKVFGASNVSKLLGHLPVVNLQAQLASLKEQAAQGFLNGSATANPNDKYCGRLPSHPQDVHSWFHQENSNIGTHFEPNLQNHVTMIPYNENGFMNPNSFGIMKIQSIQEKMPRYGSFAETSHSMSLDMQNRQQAMDIPRQ